MRLATTRMKIVLYSPNFFPLVGGLEHVVLYVAHALVQLGCEVTIVCQTPADAPDAFPFCVLRKASWVKAWAAMHCADAVLMFNVSIKGLPLVLMSGRPWAVSHQTPYGADWRGRVKVWVARHLARRNICCSAHLAAHLGGTAVVIPNPYDEGTFYNGQPWVFRTGDLIFVGRLVSDKGADVLLQALVQLHARGKMLQLTVVGEGPEETALHSLAAQHGLSKWVVFMGAKRGKELSALLQRHRVLVVPSVWPEPFGIVALEGLACGCVVVASHTGGLPEALGGLGLLFPPGDAAALADAIEGIWERPFEVLPDADRVAAHLSCHRREAIAQRYLAVLSEIIR